MSSAVQVGASELTAELATVLPLIADLSLDRASAAELREVWAAKQTLARALVAVDHAVIHQLRCREGDGAVRTIATHLLRPDPDEIGKRIGAAKDPGHRSGPTAPVIAPRLPVVAAAQAAGVISARHAEVIAAIVAAVPADAEVAERPIEAWLVDAAQRFEPRTVRRLKRMIQAAYSTDDQFTERQRKRASSPATTAAVSRAATNHHPSPKPTTSSTTPTADPPPSPTGHCCAPTTTDTSQTSAGTSPCPTGCRPGHPQPGSTPTNNPSTTGPTENACRCDRSGGLRQMRETTGPRTPAVAVDHPR